MSLQQLKKQAKNLQRHLPSFIAEHPDGCKLSDCQELAARINGYPSFHAATSEKTPPAAPVAVADSPEEMGPAPSPVRQISYTAAGSGIERTADYWIVDIGNHVAANRAMTAVILLPRDAEGDGSRDTNLLLNRDEIREDVFRRIARSMEATGSGPDAFVLCAHDGDQPIYGLAFEQDRVGDFEKRRRIPTDLMSQILHQLQQGLAVRRYERHVLRLAISRNVPVRTDIVPMPREEFEFLLAWASQSVDIAERGRAIGLRVHLSEDQSLFRDMMWDCARFDDRINRFVGNCVDPTPSEPHTFYRGPTRFGKTNIMDRLFGR